MTPWNSDIGEWEDMEPESIMTKLENENKALKKELAAAKAGLLYANDKIHRYYYLNHDSCELTIIELSNDMGENGEEEFNKFLEELEECDYNMVDKISIKSENQFRKDLSAEKE